MLMVNIGVMLVFSSGAIDIGSEVGNESRSILGSFFSTTQTDFSQAGDVTYDSDIVGSSSIADPTTEDSETDQTIFRTDNPLRMIADLLKLILGSLFGVLYVLISAQAPIWVIMIIGVPFTLIYVLAGIMFVRGVN